MTTCDIPDIEWADLGHGPEATVLGHLLRCAPTTDGWCMHVDGFPTSCTANVPGALVVKRMVADAIHERRFALHMDRNRFGP